MLLLGLSSSSPLGARRKFAIAFIMQDTIMLGFHLLLSAFVGVQLQPPSAFTFVVFLLIFYLRAVSLAHCLGMLYCQHLLMMKIPREARPQTIIFYDSPAVPLPYRPFHFLCHWSYTRKPQASQPHEPRP